MSMLDDPKERARMQSRVLIESLPYLREYHGETVVIKYGGNAMINEELKDAVMGDIVLLSLIGIKVVLVHGGGPEITDMLGKVGKESKFVDGLRVTDEETVEIVQMVLAGKINKSLVNLIQNKGGSAIGLSGMDGKVNMIAMATDAAVKAGAHAGNLIKEIAKLVGGGGGGRPNMAQAGGKNPAGIDEAVAKAKEVASAQLS